MATPLALVAMGKYAKHHRSFNENPNARGMISDDMTVDCDLYIPHFHCGRTSLVSHTGSAQATMFRSSYRSSVIIASETCVRTSLIGSCCLMAIIASNA